MTYAERTSRETNTAGLDVLAFDGRQRHRVIARLVLLRTYETSRPERHEGCESEEQDERVAAIEKCFAGGYRSSKAVVDLDETINATLLDIISLSDHRCKGRDDAQ